QDLQMTTEASQRVLLMLTADVDQALADFPQLRLRPELALNQRSPAPIPGHHALEHDLATLTLSGRQIETLKRPHDARGLGHDELRLDRSALTLGAHRAPAALRAPEQ